MVDSMCRVMVDSLFVGGVFGLVVFGGVDGVFGDDFAGFFVDDDGVVGVDEDEGGSVFVGSADSEVEELA